MGRSKDQRVTVVLRSDAPSKPETVTLKITLPVEVSKILKVEALGRNSTVGQVVAELVEGSPRRFVLSERGKQARRSDCPADPEPQPALLVRGEAGPYGPLESDVA